jgi:hypothetical protein
MTQFYLNDSDVGKIKAMNNSYQRGKKIPRPIQIRRANPRIFGGGIDIRRAKLTASAGAGNTITANLYKNGVEQTTGEEAGVTVYCDVADGESDLNICIPRLTSGKEIKVVKLAFDNSGTVEQRWYCTNTIFQPIDTAMLDIISNKLSDKLDSCA